MNHLIQNYKKLYEDLPTDKKIIPGIQSNLFGQNSLFNTDTIHTYIIPKWVKKFITNTIRYEDIITSIHNATKGNSTYLSSRILLEYNSINEDNTTLQNTLF